MTGAVRAAAQREVDAPLEQAIEDRLREVAIMQHITERRQRLVGREEHRPPLEVSLVDHAIEHVRGIGGMREIAQLVDLCEAPHKSINGERVEMWSVRR